MNRAQIAWNLYSALRAEIVETQKLRAAIVGLKITFVTSAIGFVFFKDLPRELLALPAFAAIAFDFLIIASTKGIKRKGAYLRQCLEPIVRRECKWRSRYPLWELALSRMREREYLPMLANIAMTILAAVPALIYVALQSAERNSSAALLLAMSMAVVMVSALHIRSDRKITFDRSSVGPPPRLVRPRSPRVSRFITSLHSRHRRRVRTFAA